jgi:hypothetical protein
MQADISEDEEDEEDDDDNNDDDDDDDDGFDAPQSMAPPPAANERGTGVAAAGVDDATNDAGAGHEATEGEGEHGSEDDGAGERRNR